MTRPLSVTVSALLVILGSLLAVGIGLMMFGLRHDPDLTAAGGPGLMIAMAGFVALCGAAGIATGIGLLKLKQWARISIVVFATILVLLCVFSLLLILAAGIPLPQGTDAEKLAFVKPILIGAYLVPTAIGTWWLVLFTRPQMIDVFRGDAVATDPAIPTAVLVVAWLTLFGGAAMALMPLFRLPAFFLGIVFSGWSGTLFYVVLAVLQLYIGRGLLRLQERARVLAIWFYIVGTVNGLMLLLLPSVRARAAELSADLGVASAEPAPLDPDLMLIWSSVMIIGAVVVQTWLLVRWKHVFKSP